MDLRLIRRAAALAIAAFLVSATAVFADTVPADGDSLLPGNQALIDLGTKAPGETLTHSVNFSLVCGGTSHADPGQTITIQAQSLSKPLDGTISSTSTTIGPVPSTWTLDGASCPSPLPVLAANGPVTVTLKMPTTPGIDYNYSVIYARIGANGLSGTTAINFLVDVVANTPPTLSLPSPITAEATSAAGATVLYVAGAVDAEDDPDPTPTCTPASGATFPLGNTTVSCSATDSGGLTATGSFTVTVNDSIAPTLTLPADITVEATSASGAVVSYLATATDLVDPAPVVACAPASGSTFPLGTTTVDCTATDATGNQSAGSFDVAVADTTAPALALPGPMAVEATGPSGTVVSYVATASDAVDPASVVACAPASGSAFPLGTTSVTCTATDSTGNQSSGSFDVMVGDTAVPGMTLPGTIVAEATGPSGAVVTYTVAVDDSVDPAPVIHCTPASGSTFPLGTSTVTCTATDATGNQSTGSFSVVVRDTTAPVLSGVPSDNSVTTTNPDGAAVSWPAPSATDGVSGDVGVSCSPRSGSTFPVGTTSVRCSASDAAGNTATATFRVTVTLEQDTTVYDVQWGEPITDGTLVANQGRTVPLKFRLFIDGVERTTGTAVLSVVPCGGGTALIVPLSFGGGRWMGHLDTSSLNPGCYVATALIDGQTAGTFTIDLRGADPAPSTKPKPKK
jgi:HYR domain